MDKIIAINNLPDEAFLRGILVQNIAKVRILTRDEKKHREPGSPDVMIQYNGQGTSFITRTDLIQNCRTHDGRKITIGAMKEGQVYTVTVPAKLNVYAFHVPNTSMPFGLALKNKSMKLRPGQFVVYAVNNGSISKNSPIVLSKDSFVKMIVITEKSKAQYNARLKKALEAFIARKNTIDRADMARNNPNITTAERVRLQREKERALEIPNTAPYKIVGRIIRRGTLDNVIGYMVTNGKLTKAFPTSNVMEMCKNKKVKNATLVRNQAGKVYLRGVGTVLDTLPVTYK